MPASEKSKSRQKVSVLLFVQPEAFRAELNSFISTIPNVEIEISTSFEPFTPLINHRYVPFFAVIDIERLTEDSAALAWYKKGKLPNSRYVMLVNSLNQWEMAKGMGADEAFLLGMESQELHQRIDKALHCLLSTNRLAE